MAPAPVSYWARFWGMLLAMAAVASHAYPSIDGTGNNKNNPAWGAAMTPFIRQQVPEAAYNASGDSLAGANRPSAREISLALKNSPYFKASSDYNTSYLLSALGQLVSIDVTRILAEGDTSAGQAAIVIPPGDPDYSAFANGTALLQGSRSELPFTRSAYRRSAQNGPRQAINSATSFLDASCLYGDNANITNVIRTGTGGLLLDDGQQLLPFNSDRLTGAPMLKMKNQAARLPQTLLRLSGNPNVNQNPFPLVMTTLLLREHNRRAREFAGLHPDWSDEQVFQEARKWVRAHFQRVALEDYMQGLGIPLPAYSGYNASINPSVDTFFSTVAYRYGHSTISDVVLRLNPDWTEHAKGHLTMMQSYYNPNVVLEAGIEPLIRGLIAMPQGKIEARWSSAVAANLMGQSGVNGTDLAAINIQRGRDHGIPDYNTCRRLMGLAPVKSFSEISPDTQLAATLQQQYGSVDNVDAYVGGLAEPHFGQAHVGELFFRSIQDQMLRLRDGDWWYFENTNNSLFNSSEIQEIRNTSLRDLILRNTNITAEELPQDIWVATGTAAGMCSNPSSSSSSSSDGSSSTELLVPNLLDGSGQVQITRVGDDWVRVKVTAAGDGWLGFGVARQGSEFPMIGADMVVATVVNGVPKVARYHAVDHLPPIEASQASTDDRIRSASFQQSKGVVMLEFERPLDASSTSADDNTNSIPLDGPATFIMARGPSNEFGSLQDYHGRSNREIITVPKLFSSQNSAFTAVGGVPATSDAVKRRRAHGILMTVNFMVVMPLGALAARQLRCHWLKNAAVRASLFYVHIATQLTGVVITTAGFIIATRLFGIKYNMVAWGHGQIGVALLVLIYSQLLMGLVRPAASAPTMRRHMWDVGHALLGRAAMMLGVLNAILGIIIFTTAYGGNLSVWGGLCAAALASINLLQYMLDRQEKFAVLQQDQQNRKGGLAPSSADAKDVTAVNDITAPADGAHPNGGGGWVQRKLTASFLKRHENAAAAEAAGVPQQPPFAAAAASGYDHPHDGNNMGYGPPGFQDGGLRVPADDLYHDSVDDHANDVYGQVPQQQQQQQQFGTHGFGAHQVQGGPYGSYNSYPQQQQQQHYGRG